MVAGMVICLEDYYPARHLKNQKLIVLDSTQRFELLRRADKAGLDLKKNLSNDEIEKLSQFWIAKELNKENYYCLPTTVCKRTSF